MMDDPRLAPSQYQAALKGLDRIHAATRMGDAVLAKILKWAAPIKRRLSLVELGAGSGHLSRWLAVRLAAAGVDAEIKATDLRPAPGVAQLDALDPARLPEADIYYSCLFLHHLSDGQAARMLALQGAKAGLGLMHLDLERHFLHYYGAKAFLRLVPGMHPINHHDAAASIQQGFSHADLAGLLHEANLAGRVEWIFPFRWLLSWRRP